MTDKMGPGLVAQGYSKTVIGSREKNQDCFLVENERALFAVADGVGGGIGGEIASQMAMDAFRNLANNPDDLKTAVLDAQGKIFAEAMEKHGSPVMGTTATAIMIREGSVHLCHVGDSRCYLFRGKHLELKTEDHEFFDESMQATVLGSYLGIPTDEHPLQILEDSFLVEPGDKLILCSDGLYRQIDEPRVAQILNDLKEMPEQLVECLCEEAAEKAFSDNVTVVYVQIEAN